MKLFFRVFLGAFFFFFTACNDDSTFTGEKSDSDNYYEKEDLSGDEGDGAPSLDDDYVGSDWMGGDDTKPEGTGDSGNTGNTGDAGNTGNTGDSSDTGDTGDTGNSGNSGDTGNSGNSGDTGNSGNSGTSDDDSEIEQKPGQITAAKWSDVENWDFWQDLMINEEFSKYVSDWGFFNFKRISVQVVDGSNPAIDAVVKLKTGSENELWTARSDNNGMAYLYVDPFNKLQYEGGLTVEVTYGSDNIVKVADFDGGEGLSFEFELDEKVPDVLDLMFMIDTTGSMGDELEYLKVELLDVIDRVFKNYEQSLNIRLSVNFYRDFGDEYVVRFFPFSTDIKTVNDALKRQSANGGGDRPEAVHMALENAVDMHEWSSGAKARIMFLLLDAPPHIEQQGVPESIRNFTKAAASKGIKIIPIAASDIQKPEEFLLRAMDILTGGQYIFITDDSGIGNGHSTPTVGQYTVEYLNDLIVKTINEYLE